MGDITIDIHGVDSAEGLVIGGIYVADDFKRFGGGAPQCRAEVAAAAGSVTLVFSEVPAGRYAAAAYHDRNENHHLDLKIHLALCFHH